MYINAIYIYIYCIITSTRNFDHYKLCASLRRALAIYLYAAFKMFSYFQTHYYCKFWYLIKKCIKCMLCMCYSALYGACWLPFKWFIIINRLYEPKLDGILLYFFTWTLFEYEFFLVFLFLTADRWWHGGLFGLRRKIVQIL